MHELSIAEEVYRIARGCASGGRLEAVEVIVGELSGIEPELLGYAWEAIVSGGPNAAARLDVEWRAARQLCAICGEVPQRAAGSWLRLCPHCGGGLRIAGGDELDVRRVSFVEAAEEVPA